MKKEVLVPVLTALLAFAVPACVSAQAALDMSDLVPLVPEAPGAAGLAPRYGDLPGVMPAEISVTLPLESLETRTVDVDIDLLVQQVTAAASEVENGVGLMLTFTGQ